MINLRYHIVSLVAVFLALAIGVIAGTTVINDQVVKGLERSDATLRASLQKQQDSNGVLKSQLNLWESWGGTIAKQIEKDALRDRSVVLMLSSGVDGKIVSNVQNALTIAGATRGGTITFSSRWNFNDDTARQQLGSILGLGPAATAADVATQGADRIANRLDTPGDPNAAGDLLQALAQGGFGTPDLVVLDLNLPRVDGKEVLARIRETPSLSKTPVAIMTSSGAVRS